MNTITYNRGSLVELAYQSSAALSVLGNSIAAIILPLLVLQSTGSVISAGVVALAAGIPQFLAAALGGVIVDRCDRRIIAMLGDVVSAVSIAFLAIISDTIGLNLTWFILFAILSAIGDVPAMTAREAIAPALSEATGVSTQRLVATREALTAAATLVGPAIA